MLESPHRGEIAGSEYLALHDREVDLDLVEPTRMNGCVYGDNRWPLTQEAGRAGRSSMGRAVVHDPEHAFRGPIGFPGHDLLHEAFKRNDPCSPRADAKHLRTSNVPGREVRPRSQPLVLVLHAHLATGTRRKRRMDASAGLNTGLLIRRHDAVARIKGTSLPEPFIQIQDTTRPLLKVRCAGEDPRTVEPGSNGVLMEPAPQRGSTDGRNQPAPYHFPTDLRRAPPGER